MIKKTLQPTNELFIQFSDEEVQELGLEQGQRYEVKLQDDGSVKLTPYAKLHLDIEEWSREVLLMIIKESLDQDIPVNDVINNLLKEGIESFKKKEECSTDFSSESGLTNNEKPLSTTYNHYNVAEEGDVLEYNKSQLSTSSHDYTVFSIDPNSTNNDTSFTESYAYKFTPESDMLYNSGQE